MLILYNEPLMINHPIETSFISGFQLSNKKKFILYLFEISLVDPLTLTTVLSLFKSLHQYLISKVLFNSFALIVYYLYSWPCCGSTQVLPGYLLLWHSCTWDKTSTLWSCHAAYKKIVISFCYCPKYISSIKKQKNKDSIEKRKGKKKNHTFIGFCRWKLNKEKLDNNQFRISSN
jgi:hypothetical protein